MAFLDNSGDIILDAVLTDTGRYRLARGDGSFKITKFALGDDEIDYSLYNKNHPSGSAYYDLDILQTPVLEANTDNSSGLKSKLITINQTDLLYLPVIKLFEDQGVASRSFKDQKYFIVAADESTANDTEFKNTAGVFYTHNSLINNNNVIVHQGLDTLSQPPTIALQAELVETIYIVEMDNRLGSLLAQNKTELNRSYIDDDQIATYILSIQRNGDSEINRIPQATAEIEPNSSIAGPRGTELKLKLAATQELQTSTYLFEELGSISGSFHTIDTNLRITGGTTGYRLDIPIRYVKKV